MWFIHGLITAAIFYQPVLSLYIYKSAKHVYRVLWHLINLMRTNKESLMITASVCEQDARQASKDFTKECTKTHTTGSFMFCLACFSHCCFCLSALFRRLCSSSMIMIFPQKIVPKGTRSLLCSYCCCSSLLLARCSSFCVCSSSSRWLIFARSRRGRTLLAC